jgi:hypothetical protein
VGVGAGTGAGVGVGAGAAQAVAIKLTMINSPSMLGHILFFTYLYPHLTYFLNFTSNQPPAYMIKVTLVKTNL